ncbi:MAG: hypothetical protein ACREL5_00880 [Gemmatimonadales bacterium]
MPIDRDEDPVVAEAVARLRDEQPERDLWPGIARQLEPHRQRGVIMLRWPVALAAGLTIVVASSAGTMALLRRAAADAAGTMAPATVAATPAASDTAAFGPADAALSRAIDQLEDAVRANLSHLDPEARASVNRSLDLLDKAIAQAAARQNASPDDPRIAQYLTSTLRKKLDLLRTVAQLTQPSTGA